jgi:hypothetical protein
MHAVALLASLESKRDVPYDESIRWLVHEVGPLFGDVISREPSVFTRDVVEVRNRIAHGGAVEAVKAHWLTEGIRWLLKTYVMSRIAAVAPNASSLLRRNSSLHFLRQRLT